jgi:hypothetical protein
VSLTLLGVSQPSSASLSPGYYWANTYQALSPTTSTTKFNDVAPLDQTTYEQVGPAGIGALIGITGMLVTASSTAYTTFTARLHVTDLLTFTLHSWNGSAWVLVVTSGITPSLSGGAEWVTLTQAFTATTTRLRLSIQTQGSGIASDVRIGDWRIS